MHPVKKSLTEHGDKIGADEKAKIEAALKDAEEALKSDDKEAIEAKTEALTSASHKLAEQMYAQQQAAAGAQAGAGGGPRAPAAVDARRRRRGRCRVRGSEGSSKSFVRRQGVRGEA